MKTASKKGILYFCLALLGVAAAAVAAPAFAEDAKSAGLNPDDLKKALGLSIYLQGGYTYNGNASDSGPFDDTAKGEQNDLRIFDHKANSFMLDLAQIVFAKDPAVGNIGYKVKFSAGETAKLIHAAGMGSAGESFDVTEAYVSYVAPVGKGLRLDFGKMATFFGAEVIEAIDNPNYSRSFLFNYAIPFTHTGLKAGYAFTDSLNAAVYVVNGWDNATDNNRGKSYGVSIGYAPAEVFSILVNGMTGPEQDANGPGAPTVGSSSSNKRSLLDLVATVKPTKKLSLILNTDNGREQDAMLPTGMPGQATWDGYAAIAKYDLTDAHSIAVRGEVFHDADGFRTGTVQRLKEVTLTWETRLAGGLILRPEYRHDSSDVPAFDYVSGAATKNSQNTLALGVMYRW